MKYDKYVELISNIPKPNYVPEFNNGGKLIVCLIEYRIMDEIDYVINALLRVYNANEIGFSIVHGEKNKEYVKKYENWKNIKLINTGDHNLTRETYSVMLKTPQFWENFMNWSHVLIYQTDALILRKIDNKYFDYDYVGAPWRALNGWCKYNGGNGGFSLRNINKMIEACEKYRNESKNDIPNSNEDGYFCRCDCLNFIDPPQTEFHLSFAMETIYSNKPIGVHKLYWYEGSLLKGDKYKEFIEYMCVNLFDKETLDEKYFKRNF